MLNGYWRGERAGSGTVVWQARADHAAGKIKYEEFIDVVTSSAPSPGHCNTMGTASTMNALAEALGMSLPGCAAIPAPYRERAQIAYETGMRAVEIVHENLRPSDILTRKAFENAIVANSAIGGSTNAPIHINAIARHIGVKLPIEDWEKIGYDIPLLVDMQPAGKYLGEDYYRAGGLPAVMNQLLKAGRLHGDALTVNGKTMGDNVKRAKIANADVIRTYAKPMLKQAGFKVLKGNLFDSAIMKASVISDEFRSRYLSNPKDPGAFEGKAVVFEGPEDYHKRIENPALNIDETYLADYSGCWADRLSGIRRSREHATAGGADQKRHQFAAMHRRWPAVRDLRFAVHSQCLAGSRRQWRAGAAENRRPHSHRHEQGHRRHSDFEGGTSAAARRAGKAGRIPDPRQPDAVAGNSARHGRPTRRRHGAETGGEISARCAEISATR